MKRLRAACPSLIGLVAVLLAAAPGHGAELDLFDWSGVAPVVAEARIAGVDGGHVELAIDRVLRGELSGNVFINLKRANRERNRVTHARGIKVVTGEEYIVLLGDRPVGRRGDLPVHPLVRGVAGLQPPPQEGRPAFDSALETFIEIHEMGSDNGKWVRFASLLDETNPILLETALAQFLKFRRGEPQLVASARPLLDHPRPDIRAHATELLGQLLDRWGPSALPDGPVLRGELIALARRDETLAVRIAATRALAAYDDDATDEIFEEIAASDPEQDVRYHAERLLYERRLRRGTAER